MAEDTDKLEVVLSCAIAEELAFVYLGTTELVGQVRTLVLGEIELTMIPVEAFTDAGYDDQADKREVTTEVLIVMLALEEISVVVLERPPGAGYVTS